MIFLQKTIEKLFLIVFVVVVSKKIIYFALEDARKLLGHIALGASKSRGA